MITGPLVDTVPWFLPGIVLTVVISTIASGWLARAIGAGRAEAWLLLAGLGLVLVTTLTPQRDALEQGALGSGTCDFSRVIPASLSFYAGANDSFENVLLFVPLGVAIALLPARWRPLWILAGLALPVAIELLQRQVIVLNRSCQSADVVDNLLGLGIGLAVGAAIAVAGRRSGALRRARVTDGRRE